MLDPLLIDAKELARLLSLSLRTVRSMMASGRTPKPIKINGGSVRFLYTEVRAWCEAGCPGRAEWEAGR